MIETRADRAPEREATSASDVRSAVRLKWTATALMVFLAVAVWFLSPALRTEITRLVQLVAGGNVDALGERLSSYGVWGPLASLGIMVLQGILAPLPAFVVTFANGLAFGPLVGWLISFIGHLLASSVCFALARRVGRRRVESLVSTRGLQAADRWLERWGPHAVLLTRLAPGISFDGISYAAGLTSITFRRFAIATAVGVIPETLLFAYLGHSAQEHTTLVMGISLTVAVFGLVAAVLLGRARRNPAE